MKSLFLSVLLSAGMASARLCTYIDEYHNKTLPPREMNSGIDCVVLAFVNSSYPLTMSGWSPWWHLDEVKSHFNEGTKFMAALGGWGDTAGFSEASKTNESRTNYAKNVKSLLDQQNLDGIDIDWEYPGGNGADYKTDPNQDKKAEVANYPKFLAAIRSQIGPNKNLSIAVPGKGGDMIAFTNQTGKSIFEQVDTVNIMSYDLINRRNTIAGHASSVQGSKDSVQRYLDVGMPPEKGNLGFAFYARWFYMKPGCQDKNGTGLGCPIVDGETQSGQDAGTSGTLTWQKDNLEEPGNNLTISSEGTCGISIGKKCQATDCCSSDGFCGTTPQHCGMACVPGLGRCNSTTAIGSFKSISGKKHIDEKQGGATAVDNSGSQSIFWTWDPVELYQRKFDEIVKAKKLGGVMVWSLGQDSDGWTHIKKIQSLNQQANGKPVTTQGV